MENVVTLSDKILNDAFNNSLHDLSNSFHVATSVDLEFFDFEIFDDILDSNFSVQYPQPMEQFTTTEQSCPFTPSYCNEDQTYVNTLSMACSDYYHEPYVFHQSLPW